MTAPLYIVAKSGAEWIVIDNHVIQGSYPGRQLAIDAAEAGARANVPSELFIRAGEGFPEEQHFFS